MPCAPRAKCYGRIVRPVVPLGLAIPLIVADLWVKSNAIVPEWAYHERGPAWVALCAGLVLLLLLLTRIPSAVVPPAIALAVAGLLGNVLSAVQNDLAVPNPLLLTGAGGQLAFNLADLYALVGIVLLGTAVSVWAVRNRERLNGLRAVRSAGSGAGHRARDW
jgi:hypothetical protein